jgi:AcrR family transcriptional regulator
MNSSKTVNTGLESTKQIIVQTALTLFSQFGIEGVSLSKLREQAGQQNRSAIHYHFDNKEGLLTAVTAYISDLILAEIAETISNLQKQEANQSGSLQEVLATLYSPLLDFYFKDENGKSCIRFISHMAHEMDEARRELAFQPLQPLLDAAFTQTARFFKDQASQDHAVRIYLGTATLLEMLAFSGMLARKHVIAGNEVNIELDSKFRARILAYMSSGMSSLS